MSENVVYPKEMWYIPIIDHCEEYARWVAARKGVKGAQRHYTDTVKAAMDDYDAGRCSLPDALVRLFGFPEDVVAKAVRAFEKKFGFYIGHTVIGRHVTDDVIARAHQALTNLVAAKASLPADQYEELRREYFQKLRIDV